ncbi:hypothetical protein PoB_002925800 [Plakobranchus ocellatus]|uniref:Uncharacterized protein n=1 Tax=Plakobranchus ocellatus TaxID=259542 RepID=A0AAV4A6C4_9GAST|nr:hypothetical protein PoB_002925800 [Plakobranchus ocellatus]
MSQLDSNLHPRCHPPPCQTEKPSEQATESSASTKIEGSDSSYGYIFLPKLSETHLDSPKLTETHHQNSPKLTETLQNSPKLTPKSLQNAPKFEKTYKNLR